ncbi:hypothetical protein [Clostridioides sp. ES-S-0006-03]
MDYLYTSETYKLISDGISDMHCKDHIFSSRINTGKWINVP